MLINIIGIASSTTCVVARTLHTVTSIAFDALGVPAKPVVNYLRHYDLFRKNIHPCIKTLYYITLSTLSEDFINKFTTSYLFATIGVVIFAKSWYNYTSNLPIKLYINHKYYQGTEQLIKLETMLPSFLRFKFIETQTNIGQSNNIKIDYAIINFENSQNKIYLRALIQSDQLQDLETNPCYRLYKNFNSLDFHELSSIASDSAYGYLGYNPKMIQYHIYSYAQQKIKWLRDFIAENSGIIFHPWNPLLAGVNSLDNYLDVVLKSIKTKADSIAYQKGVLIKKCQKNLPLNVNQLHSITFNNQKLTWQDLNPEMDKFNMILKIRKGYHDNILTPDDDNQIKNGLKNIGSNTDNSNPFQGYRVLIQEVHDKVFIADVLIQNDNLLLNALPGYTFFSQVKKHQQYGNTTFPEYENFMNETNSCKLYQEYRLDFIDQKKRHSISQKSHYHDIQENEEKGDGFFSSDDDDDPNPNSAQITQQLSSALKKQTASLKQQAESAKFVAENVESIATTLTEVAEKVEKVADRVEGIFTLPKLPSAKEIYNNILSYGGNTSLDYEDLVAGTPTGAGFGDLRNDPNDPESANQNDQKEVIEAQMVAFDPSLTYSPKRKNSLQITNKGVLGGWVCSNLGTGPTMNPMKSRISVNYIGFQEQLGMQTNHNNFLRNDKNQDCPKTNNQQQLSPSRLLINEKNQDHVVKYLNLVIYTRFLYKQITSPETLFYIHTCNEKWLYDHKIPLNNRLFKLTVFLINDVFNNIGVGSQIISKILTDRNDVNNLISVIHAECFPETFNKKIQEPTLKKTYIKFDTGGDKFFKMFGIKEAISKNLYLGQEKNKPTKKTLDTFIKNVMGYKLDDSSVKYFNFCHPYYQRYIGELSELLSKSDSNEKLSFHNFYQQSYQQNQQLDSQFIIKYMIWLYKFQIQNLWNHIRQKNNIDNHVELFNDIRNNLDQINLTQPTRPDPDPFSHLSLESYAVACANYKQEKARVDSGKGQIAQFCQNEWQGLTYNKNNLNEDIHQHLNEAYVDVERAYTLRYKLDFYEIGKYIINNQGNLNHLNDIELKFRPSLHNSKLEQLNTLLLNMKQQEINNDNNTSSFHQEFCRKFLVQNVLKGISLYYETFTKIIPDSQESTSYNFNTESLTSNNSSAAILLAANVLLLPNFLIRETEYILHDKLKLFGSLNSNATHEGLDRNNIKNKGENMRNKSYDPTKSLAQEFQSGLQNEEPNSGEDLVVYSRQNQNQDNRLNNLLMDLNDINWAGPDHEEMNNLTLTRLNNSPGESKRMNESDLTKLENLTEFDPMKSNFSYRGEDSIDYLSSGDQNDNQFSDLLDLD